MLLAPPGVPSAAPPLAESGSVHRPSRLLLATHLVLLGESQKNPWALLMAARLLNGLGMEPSPARLESPSPPALPLQARPVLERARSLAVSDSLSAHLIPLIEDELAAKRRGTEAGDRIAHAVIGGGRTLRLHLNYVGGQRASFRIEADDLTRIRMAVLGSSGPVCQPKLENSIIHCTWHPKDNTPVVVEASTTDDVEQVLAFRHN